MSDIQMTGEIRTDYDCESSIEKDIVVAVMAGENAAWRGTLKGFKQFLRGELVPDA